MKKTSISVGVVLVSFFLLNACQTMAPQKTEYSPGLKKAIVSVDAQAALLITKDGRILAYDKDGVLIHDCRFPNSEGDLPVCSGLGKDGVVESIETITVIKTKVNPTCIILYDNHGVPHQYCW